MLRSKGFKYCFMFSVKRINMFIEKKNVNAGRHFVFNAIMAFIENILYLIAEIDHLFSFKLCIDSKKTNCIV